MEFAYPPNDYESEKASNGYLMSVVAVMVGLPLPIINLIATGFFYLGNRNGSFFVRWHCIQALLSQVLVVAFNSFGFYWTISIIFRDKHVDNPYIAYMLTLFIFNVIEFVATIIAAIQVRKGKHVQWFFFGPLTNLICKP